MEPTEPAKEATEEAVEELVQVENDAFVLATEDPLEKAQKIAEEKAKSKVIKQPKKIVNVSKIKVFLHEVGGEIITREHCPLSLNHFRLNNKELIFRLLCLRLVTSLTHLRMEKNPLV